MKLVYVHRALSGVSLVLLTAALAGADIPWLLLSGVLLATLLFYAAVLFVMTLVAAMNIRKLDIIYPLATLLATAFAVKSLLAHNILPAILPIIIMFISGYISGPVQAK